MATIRAAASGLWSATGSWIGGVVPTSADDVVANSFTIQVDGTYTVLSVRNDTLGGATAGGTFVLNNSSSLTCTATNGIIVGSSTPTITFNLPIGQSATINANIPTITAVTNYHAVLLAGLGTLNFIGNASCTTSITNLRIINITVAGTLNFIGNPTNGGTTPNQCNTIYSSAAASINITGSFSGGNMNTQSNSSVFMNNGGNITVTGNISGASSPAITINQGNVVVIGNVTGSTIEAIRNITNATPIIDVTGVVTAGSGSPAITSLALVKLSGIAINNNRYNAIYAPQVTIELTTTSWTYQTFAGPDLTLYASGASLGNPNTVDVRDGITYGPSGTLTGTLKVPSPSNVLQGVQTDATVGTLLLTAQAFWEQLTSGVSLTGSFGKLIKDLLDVAISSRSSQTSLDLIPVNPLLDNDVRIDDIKDKTDKIPNNPASVQSTGDQIASYIT